MDSGTEPLIFDSTKDFPFRLNFLPVVHLFDYANKNEAILNFVRNTTMFIPIGIIFPIVYKELNTHIKVIVTGLVFHCALKFCN